MSSGHRITDSLNRALHDLMARDAALYLLGEDIADPYGGAFGVTRQLSSRYPDRVLATPLSENGIVGVANGLALAGCKVIVEIMFADFSGLAFDQILNFTSKSVGMYGRRIPMHVVLRCPVGGNRAYGPTHSQSIQKHFIGIPHLSLHELSPFHDPFRVLHGMLDRGEPGMLFEPKTLYGERVRRRGRLDDVLTLEFLGDGDTWAYVRADTGTGPNVVLIAPGGTADHALKAARTLALEDRVRVHVLVPSQLFPLELDPIHGLLVDAEAVCVAEESTPGGTWGAEVAQRIYERCWGQLARPVTLVSSSESVIPAAPHLERQVLVQADAICQVLRSLLPSRPSPSGAPKTDRVEPAVADPWARQGEAAPVRVPKLNNNDVSYVLLSWLAEDGKQVQQGDPVAEVETSKAVQELTAALSGTLALKAAAGSECKPGDVIATLTPADVPSDGVGAGLDKGRIPSAGTRTMPLSRLQRRVAEAVTTSRQNIPDAFVVLEVPIDEVLQLEHKLADRREAPLGLLEILVLAAAELHGRFPACFARLADEHTAELSDEVNVGVTFDAGNGLFVPVVRSAGCRAADDVADELAAFRLEALRGRFSEAKLSGANIAISWNHEPDVIMVQPVIPPGLACAISVGGAFKKVSISHNGKPTQRTVVNLGLAHDHRLINGRQATDFLRELSATLQDPGHLWELATRR
jgi:pyruvate/2-oxoglutarate/acetoin dehydrogenase E1 component/pyruvate/2-oxoglutarate dehydrogenase complex dihydrolipoamide acyltransferase (E2) component